MGALFLLIAWRFGFFFLSLQQNKKNMTSYTKETLVIDNPSDKLLKVVKELRRNKLAQLEKLRNLKSEEFSRRVISCPISRLPQSLEINVAHPLHAISFG